MPWPFSFPRSFRTRSLRFVAEQDGAPEREFKQLVKNLLKRHQSVGAAYLVRVSYIAWGPYSVALCLAGPSNDKLVRELSDIFAKMFGSREHLDIAFLNGKQVVEVAAVCKPFYTRESF